jgi:hypothetical protein
MARASLESFHANSSSSAGRTSRHAWHGVRTSRTTHGIVPELVGDDSTDRVAVNAPATEDVQIGVGDLVFRWVAWTANVDMVTFR